MAHFRGVGGFATLAAGQTAYWETTYGDLLDEGIVTEAPNLLDESATNVEMIALYQSVLLRPTGERSGPVYKVAIKNAGTQVMSYKPQHRGLATKVTIISQRGRLVATQIPPSAGAMPGQPQARLVAGPGQRQHVLEIEDAEAYHQRRAASELHEVVKRRLKSK